MRREVKHIIMLVFIFIIYPSIIYGDDSVNTPSVTSISNYDYHAYFSETFEDKILKDNKVMKDNKTIWNINTAKDQKNSITETGALELGGAQYMQYAVLDEANWRKKQEYALEFTINIQQMGNEGHSERPIAMIIPRSKDKQLSEYYGVTYYMENIGNNQFKCKWAIINTAAPTHMTPIVENYFLLEENIDYTGRLVIYDTDEGGVNIKFYIDGPTNPVHEYKPLLEYTDLSPYKITDSKTGPTFGMKGYSDDGWGTSPIVRYDNIKLFDINQFEKYEDKLKQCSKISPTDIQNENNYNEIRYLLNKGLMSEYSDHTFKPNEQVTILQFLKMLSTLKGESDLNKETSGVDYYIKRGLKLGIIKKQDNYDLNKYITRYDAALMITRYLGNPAADKSYLSIIRDKSAIQDEELLNAVLFTFYEGYLRLDDDFNFMGHKPINRGECATILMRILDPGYRKINYRLELPYILSSGAVLQRDKKIPIWGRGVSGETIKAKFKKQTQTSIVKNGYWYLELEPEPYGGPYTLTIESKKDKIILKDIYVGEVFIVAGQSNAEMYLNECNGAKKTKYKLLSRGNIHFFETNKNVAVKPKFAMVGQWSPDVDWAIDWSSAIGTFFVEKLLELNKDLKNVPIGIIAMTYGGSTIEDFMPNIIMEEKGFTQEYDEPIISGFWNGFMDCNCPYSVKGVIYYQGENSTHLGYDYKPLLTDYINGVRKELNDPKLPFMLVQLSGYGDNYVNDGWPIIRDVQMKVSNTMENVGLVTAIDLADSDPMEIHPKDKKPIGERLAYLAMDLIYGRDLKYKSAKIKSYRFEGNKVIVKFEDTFGGLYLKDNVESGFEIFDAQGDWHKASAIIGEESDTVEIWCDSVTLPKGVRYAWHNYPSVSMFNHIDLPVFPFKVINTPEISSNKLLKIPNHMLNNNDAIVNLTRSGQFRLINRLDKDTISHEYSIEGQTAGDKIIELLWVNNSTAEIGTTETTIKITDHGLSVGDWIRNNTRDWKARRVQQVLDKDTILVNKIDGQGPGDEVSKFKFKDEVVAN